MRRAKQDPKKEKKASSQKRSAEKQYEGKKRSKIGCFFKTIGYGLFFLIVIAMFLLGLDFTSNRALIPVDKASGKVNVLLLGVDQDGLRTDTMMVVSYDFDHGKAKLLSIPRDTKVYVTDRSVYRKINEIHAMHDQNGELLGPAGTARVVGQVTGIPIHYYLEFNFGTFDALMNVLGPVTYDVPDVEGGGRGMNYDDPVQNLHIHLKPGVQELSGNQIQQFLRYRKSNDEDADGSDLSRIERQQSFVRALIDQKVNASLLLKIPDIFEQLQKGLKTNLSLIDVVKYANSLEALRSENLSTFQLPGVDDYVNGGWYYVLDEEAAKILIEQEFGYDASNITTDVTISENQQNTEIADGQ